MWKVRALRILILAVAGLITLSMLVYLVIAPHPPADKQLEAHFVNQRVDFDRLKEVAEEDRHMARIAQDFTWRQATFAWPRPEADWGITKERWDN
jgi:type II secretory pathway component PulM